MLTPYHPYQFVKVAAFDTYEDLVNSYYNPSSALISPTMTALGAGAGAALGALGAPKPYDAEDGLVGGALPTVVGGLAGGILGAPATWVLREIANVYGLPAAVRFSRTLGGLGLGALTGAVTTDLSETPIPLIAAPILGGIAGYYAGDLEARLRGLPTREEFESKKKKKKKK